MVGYKIINHYKDSYKKSQHSQVSLCVCIPKFERRIWTMFQNQRQKLQGKDLQEATLGSQLQTRAFVFVACKL